MGFLLPYGHEDNSKFLASTKRPRSCSCCRRRPSRAMLVVSGRGVAVKSSSLCSHHPTQNINDGPHPAPQKRATVQVLPPSASAHPMNIMIVKPTLYPYKNHLPPLPLSAEAFGRSSLPPQQVPSRSVPSLWSQSGTRRRNEIIPLQALLNQCSQVYHY